MFVHVHYLTCCDRRGPIKVLFESTDKSFSNLEKQTNLNFDYTIDYDCSRVTSDPLFGCNTEINSKVNLFIKRKFYIYSSKSISHPLQSNIRPIKCSFANAFTSPRSNLFPV